jgi:autotransporter-associated beta strand protein
LITFDSATYLAPYNDYVTDAARLQFSAGTDGMVLSGNAIQVGNTADNTNHALETQGADSITISNNIEFIGRTGDSRRSRNIYVTDSSMLTLSGTLTSDTETPAYRAFTLRKWGTGTLIINGNNSITGAYVDFMAGDGATFINNSTGNGLGNGVDVTVATAAILGGSGSFNGTLLVVGTLQPGATGNGDIGLLTVDNDVTWRPNGTLFDFDLGTAAASLASAASGGSTQDRLTIDGDFIKDTTYQSTFSFDFQGDGQKGWYKLIDWTGTTGFDSDDFTATNLYAKYSGEFTIDGGALYLEVIPEPGTLSLLAVMFGAAFFIRRRR